MRGIIIMMFALITLTLLPAAAGAQDFFVAPAAEFTGMGNESAAAGCGFAIGGGKGTALGLRFIYTTAFDSMAVNVLELDVFMRYYFFGTDANTGPFAQFISGIILIARDNAFSLPAGAAAFSAGLGAGWRIPLGEVMFLEPAIRAGYPYIFGVSMSVGFGL
jgi:hypothetical protein